MAQSQQLDGKVAIVTGASSGIGAEIARAFGAAGAAVVLVGRSEERLAETRAAVEAEGARAVTVAADICAAEAPDQIVAQALEAFGRIDVVVHAAGVYRPGALGQITDADFDAHWETNTRAPFRLTRAVRPHLGEGAAVIFLSSASGHVGSAGDIAYCASKGGVELMVKAFAAELAPEGVRVNAVAPGTVHSPMNAHLLTPEITEEWLAFTPAGRFGEVGDISPAVVFLASDAAAYIHGVSLVIDGGLVAQ
ncbi:SDR family oxidoreductase [Nocardioides marmoriginsengisoli]|uniref:SDR family oxidoreductase n=1 Tax=Nocardioides marmoriginsengisoli TaxID=661483 RepID=A0A3N0CGB3_9ACTN|nr:SDR family oxidoreductase [Nocardioides marmoriginsengisoli]RNL62512.1 SDR family oxidoreductase [Nocardioides marmoriginsengisoli]